MTKYLELVENEKATHLKVDVRYNLGGFNAWTYKNERRGYYLHITPVKKDGIWESFEAFSGVKVLVLEVTRKSAKKLAEAEKIAEKTEGIWIQMVLNKHGLKLKKEDA